MMAGAVYTLPAQRNVPLPVAMQRLIPMATQGGKPRSFTLPRDSNLHSLLVPPAKEEQQARNGEFASVGVGAKYKGHDEGCYTNDSYLRPKKGFWVCCCQNVPEPPPCCEADGFLFKSSPFKSQRVTHHAMLW